MYYNIQPWISIDTYHSYKISNVIFINDSQSHTYYLIKNIPAVIFEKILLGYTFEEIQNYINISNLKFDLPAFLSELKENNIINSNIKNIHSRNKYIYLKIDKKNKNYEYFIEKKNQLDTILKPIYRIFLELNYSCNLSCKHCCNYKNLDKYEINFQSAKKIIDEAYELGVGQILLTGGECTINKDFYKIAKYIRTKHINLSIFTNGQKLYDDKELFENIVNLYPSVIKISLYSMNADIHDNITQVKGSHKKTLSLIKKLKERNVPLSIGCQVLAYNKECYKDVKDFANSIGSEFVTSCSFYNNPKNNNLSARLCEKDAEKYYLYNIQNFGIRPKFKKNKEPICNACNARISIQPDLTITPCLYFNYSLGNYSTTSLKDIIKSKKDKFRKVFIRENLKECFKNEYCKFCLYCPASISYESDFLKNSSTLCEDAKAYYKAYIKYKRQQNNKIDM